MPCLDGRPCRPAIAASPPFAAAPDPPETPSPPAYFHPRESRARRGRGRTPAAASIHVQAPVWRTPTSAELLDPPVTRSSGFTLMNSETAQELGRRLAAEGRHPSLEERLAMAAALRGESGAQGHAPSGSRGHRGGRRARGARASAEAAARSAPP